MQRRPEGEERRADPRSLITPETWVRDYIQAQRNHWPELEEASESIGGALNHPLSIAEPLRQRLKEAWGVEVRVVGPEILEDASQSYDPQRRILLLSSLLRSENRQFGIAYQLALLEFAPIMPLLLQRPGDCAADALRPQRRCVSGDWNGLRREARPPHCLCRRARPARHDGHACRTGVRHLPAVAMPIPRDGTGGADVGSRRASE